MPELRHGKLGLSWSLWGGNVGIYVFRHTIAGVTYDVAVRFRAGGWFTLIDWGAAVPGRVINSALAAANTVGLGEVTVCGATYPLEIAVTYPANDLTLAGMGRATFLDGDALATNIHAIVISGYTDCVVKDLAVQTEDGGGKTCHCVFIEDGADRFRLESIIIVESDSDGIHLEGTSIDEGYILTCSFLATDDNSLYIEADAANNMDWLEIHGNKVSGGGNGGYGAFNFNRIRYSTISENKIDLQDADTHGIVLQNATEIDVIDNKVLNMGNPPVNPRGAIYVNTVTFSHFEHNTVDTTASWSGFYLAGVDNSTFSSNTIINADLNGLFFFGTSDNNTIEHNIITANGNYGILIGAGCTGNIIGENNYLLGNTTGCIFDLGTDTRLPEITVYVAEPNGTIGRHPCVVLTDGVQVTVRFEIHIPSSFQELVRARVVVVPGADGNMNRGVETEWGKICTELYDATSDSIAAAVVAGLTNKMLECMDVAAALDGIEASDDIGLEFTRYGAAGTDTIDADCYLLKFNMQYV